MRLNIFTKLFVTILIAAFAVILCVLVFMNWSFRSGFADYQYRSDLEKAEQLVEVLVEDFRIHGSWDYIRNDRINWSLALAQIGEGRFANPEMRGERGRLPRDRRVQRDDPEYHFNPGRPPPPPRGLAGRLRLLDQDKLPVIGRQGDVAQKASLPIRLGDKTVGWLELERRVLITDQLAANFQQRQAHNAYWIALIAVVLSLLIAYLAARQFLRPVLRLTEGAKTLSTGNYAARINARSGDELGDLAGHFNHLAASLERNEEMRAQWIADISHELRTPLAVLRSEVEALLDGIRQPTIERIQSLHAEILSLGKLVDDLYQLSLSDAGALVDRGELALLDVNALLQGMQSSASIRLAEKSIKFQSGLQPKPLQVRGDDKRLRQLFSNLLENSYRYTDEGGQVRINTRQADGQAVIEVQDSHPGVPDEALPRLFDRLYRVDKSRSRALGGSGLGLSICKNIVEAHGGTIRAEHSPLGGLSVVVRLPLMTN